MARKRRACCEIVREGEPPKGGERGASGGGAKRRAAKRASMEREPPAMGAERPSHGGGKTRSCRLHRQAQARSERQRAKTPGIVTERRRPRSGLRGAGRGEAAPGGIEPGDRSEGPGGRPDLATRGSEDGGQSSARPEDNLREAGAGTAETGPPQTKWWRRPMRVWDEGRQRPVRWRRARRGGVSRSQNGAPTR